MKYHLIGGFTIIS